MQTSANMKLQVPTIGADNDPAWQSEIVYTFNKIDVHTHDGLSSGIKIPFNNLNFAQPGGNSSTPSMGNAPITGLGYLGLQFQNSVPSFAKPNTGLLEIDSIGTLYYITQIGKVKLADIGGINTGGSATNGITGGIYQTSAGNLNYTANLANSSWIVPGYHSTVQWLQNIFTFSTTTAPISTTAAPANIAAGPTIYAAGINPSFYLYDFAAASAAGGLNLPPKKGYAAEFASLGNGASFGSALSYQFGIRSRYASNLNDLAFPTYVFSVNSSFNGNTISTTSNGVVPFTHIFNASFTDNRSPSATSGNNADAYQFIGYNASGAVATPQHYMHYVQYAINPSDGTSLNTTTANSEAGFGMQFRYQLQRPTVAASSVPTFSTGTFIEAARQEVFFSDSTNQATGYRLFLAASTSYINPAFTLAFAPQTGALPVTPALQGVMGPNALRSAHFGTGSGVLTSSSPGFVFNTPLYIASTPGVYISPTHDNSGAIGQPASRLSILYAVNINTSNVFASQNSTFAAAVIGGQFLPTKSYVSGNGQDYGLYLNTRVVGQGFVSGNGTTVAAAGGANFSNASISVSAYYTIVINLLNPLPSTNCGVIATGGDFSGATGFVGVLSARVNSTNPAQIQILYGATGVNPTSYTVFWQVFQFG